MKSTGIGFVGILTVLFIALKLTNVIDWPWFSLNPFELSVFIAPVISVELWVLILLGIFVFWLFETGKIRFPKRKKSKR